MSKETEYWSKLGLHCLHFLAQLFKYFIATDVIPVDNISKKLFELPELFFN